MNSHQTMNQQQLNTEKRQLEKDRHLLEINRHLLEIDRHQLEMDRHQLEKDKHHLEKDKHLLEIDKIQQELNKEKRQLEEPTPTPPVRQQTPTPATNYTTSKELAEQRGQWKVEPIPRFKILETYSGKENTAFQIALDDGRYATFNPYYAYRHNGTFTTWFDTQNTSSVGVKYDPGTKKNGKVPVSWKGLRAREDYVITSSPLTAEQLNGLWG